MSNITFDNVVLVNASKLKPSFKTLTTEKLLISGRRKQKTSTEVASEMTFECLGAYSDVTAIRGKIGTKGSLVTDRETFSDMVITGKIEVQETDNPDYFLYTVSFAEDTS